MAKITIEELSQSLREYLNGLGLTEAQVQELIDAFEDEKIGDIQDLHTTNKENIVAAINEVFQSGNNVKQNLVDALIAKGASCSTSDSFSRLIGLIYGLTSGEDSGSGNENLPTFEGSNTWSSCASMRVNRYALSGAAVGKKIYVIGGYNSTYSNSVEMYDTELGIWETKTSMPDGLAYLSANAIGDNIYVIGGSLSNSKDSAENDYTLVPHNYIYIYDTLTDTWTKKAKTLDTINNYSSSTVGTCSTVVGTKIFYTGGVSYGDRYRTLGCYDTSTDTITMGYGYDGSMPNTGYVHRAMGYLNSKIYVAGGKGYGTNSLNGSSGITAGSIFSPNATDWRDDDFTLPEAMHSMAYCVVNEKFYILGGVYGSKATSYGNNGSPGVNTGTIKNSVFEFDPYTNKWTKHNSLLTPRYAAVAVPVDNIIYYIGGVDATGTPSNLVEAYCPPGVEPPKFNTGSSNAGGLDIITATELPSEVVDNQMVLITDAEPTSIKLSPVANSTSTVDGQIVVPYATSENSSPFNVVHGNALLTVYPQQASLYTGGSEKLLNAYVGVSGSWVQFSWSGIFAFMGGIYRNTDLFGEFTNAASSANLYSAYPPEISGNTIKIGQTSASRDTDDYYKGNALYYFTKQINCANYSRLKITVTNYSKSNVQSGYMYFGVKQTTNSSFTSSDQYISITGTGTYEVDLSSYTKSGYVAAYIYSNSYSTTKNPSAYVYISSIELIK